VTWAISEKGYSQRRACQLIDLNLAANAIVTTARRLSEEVKLMIGPPLL
jgi:hypothetical protein